MWWLWWWWGKGGVGGRLELLETTQHKQSCFLQGFWDFNFPLNSSTKVPTSSTLYYIFKIKCLPTNNCLTCPGLNLFENPKSVSLTMPSFSKNTTFSGLRSLWTTWSLWQYCIAVTIWLKYFLAISSPRPPSCCNISSVT